MTAQEEMMQEWIQRIAVYVVLVTVLRSLAGKPHYQQYFRFVSGLILILLLAAPVLRFFHNGSDLYDLMQNSLYQQDVDEMQSSMQAAEGEMEMMIREEYQNLVQSQVTELAGNRQLTVEKVSVTIDGQAQITRIEIHLAKGQDTVEKSELRAFRKEVEMYYQLEEECVVLWI